MHVGVPVRDASAVMAGARFRLSAGPGGRITAAELEPADTARLASDFAGVLGESEATYGG
ncbi:MULTISPECIES: hypothetical protein [Streptomyces]|uniref:hypothetical protein n=1 Tax=Streptomyces TaxID=1883 RepID=UPI000743C691|nr:MULTISPECIES: hypothetical protein [Streptomyces]MDI5909148.1 hypothetical protein [Streptomyces sp. 12257]